MWTLPQKVKIQNVPIVKEHNDMQHASPHHEVATDVKQMPIRPIFIIMSCNGDAPTDDRKHGRLRTQPAQKV